MSTKHLLILTILAVSISFAARAQQSSSVSVVLAAQNGSGKSGKAVITTAGSKKTRVTVTMQDSGDYPAGIYLGVCSDMGGPAYQLSKVVKGKSTTELAVDFSSFQPSSNGSRPLAVNVGPNSSSVACGDFMASAQ
jgi:opacity protein-like surface antigen